MSLVETDPYSVFLFGMRSPKTKEKMVARLRSFFYFIGLREGSMEKRSKIVVEKSSQDINWLYTNLVKYLQYQKERVEKKEISAGTVKNYFHAVKFFCEMNQMELPWKRISRALPKVKRYADDRAPTIEEIQRICEYPDRRIKPIIYVMTSSGIRIGAWDYLQWKHVSPMYRNDKLVGAKMIVYAGESEEYFTFISSEAYLELKKWIDYREQCGEKIDLESWLMRNRWDKKKGYTRGLISAPVKLQAAGVKRVIEDALWTQRIRTKLDSDKERHQFQSDHGFRKWFKTRCEIAGMKPINIEKLMGHSTGISDSYYRPTKNEIFDDYLQATESLLIEKGSLLKHTAETISTKNRRDQIIFSRSLLEKDREIQMMKDQFTSLQLQVKLMMQAIGTLNDTGRNEFSKVFIKSKLYQ